MYKYGDKCEYYKLYDRKADGRRRLKKKKIKSARLGTVNLIILKVEGEEKTKRSTERKKGEKNK